MLSIVVPVALALGQRTSMPSRAVAADSLFGSCIATQHVSDLPKDKTAAVSPVVYFGSENREPSELMDFAEWQFLAAVNAADAISGHKFAICGVWTDRVKAAAERQKDIDGAVKEGLTVRELAFRFRPDAERPGPNEDKTVAWLNATLPPLVDGPFKGVDDLGSFWVALVWETETTKPIEVANINPGDLSNISWMRVKGAPRITFSGTITTEARDRSPYYRRRFSEVVPTANLFLRPETSDTDAERVVKALKHLALLQGAALVQDDLFK